MIKAEYSDKDCVVDILTEAFDSNKSVNYVVKQDKKRKQRIRKLMDYSFEVCWASGEIYLSSDKKGAALIQFPLKKKTTLTSIWQSVLLIRYAIGIKRLFKIVQREQYLEKIRPKTDYMYFWYLGVIPEFQGQCPVMTFRDEIFEIADLRQLPIYLETSGEKQKNVYQRCGFEIYHTWKMKKEGFTMYCMARFPK